MHLRLDPHNGEPIYRQIVEQVKYLVACGKLQDGDRLPSIRSLGDTLKINPRTVVKAYEELQAAGLVMMKQGQGVFVTADRGTAPLRERRKAIGLLAQRLFAEASRMGAGSDEIWEILQQTAEQMEFGPWPMPSSKP